MIATPFASERLTMRPQTIDDAVALHVAYRDEDLMRYWSSAPHTSVEETIVYLTPRTDFPNWRGWTMRLGDDGPIIGTIAAGRCRPGVSEIGYLLRRDFWGRGYAREGVSALINRLFSEENQRRVFADTDPDNLASNTLLARLGFRREGLLRGEWETHIGVRDSVIWGLLREEWDQGLS